MKKIFKYIIISYLICLASLGTVVDAAGVEGDTGSGDYANPNSCGGGSSICYSGQGLRFSLYKNNSQNSNTKIGTTFDIWYTGTASDVWSNPYSSGSFKAETDSGVWYTSPTRDNVNGKLAGTILTKSDFSLKYSEYKKYLKDRSIGEAIVEKYAVGDKAELTLAEVHEEWVYDTFDDYKNVNSYFGTNFTATSDLTNYFITVEQLYKVNNKSYSSSFGYGSYVGTAYELKALDRTEACMSWGNNTALVYTQRSDGKESFHQFLQKTGLKAVEMVLTPEYDSEHGCDDDAWVTANLATPATVGMAVYRLTDFMPPSSDGDPTDDSCPTTCSGKTGDSLLKCAENSCSGDSDKADCMKNCGVTPPGFSTCPSATACPTTESNTDCNDTAEGTASSCYTATAQTGVTNITSNYYKVTCTENTSAEYNSSLPAVIKRGTGFGYTMSIAGGKVCTYTFEYDRWKYDYAMSSGVARITLEGILNNFKNGNVNTTLAKYDSSDVVTEIKISEKINGKNQTTTKNLEITATTPSTVYLAKNGSINIKTYADGAEKTFTVPSSLTATSNATASYALPGLCIDNLGNVYNPVNNSCGDTLAPRYYYTSKYANDGKNYVTITTKKTSSCLNDENSCYYNITSSGSASCRIVQDTTDSNKYVLEYSTSNLGTVTYGISLTKNQLNNSTVITATKGSTTKTIYGTVASSDKSVIYATCSLEIPKANSATCEVVPVDDDGNMKLKIETDLTGYSYGLSTVRDEMNNKDSIKIGVDATAYGTVKNSAGNIVARCEYTRSDATPPPGGTPPPSGGGTPRTCKLLYDEDDYNEIRSYCSGSWNVDTAGYTSEDECYRDCTGTDNNCKYVITDRSDVTKVINYCSANFKQDGYTSENSCFVDCFDSTGNGLGYIYRPISLSDPFPNGRDAGANWLGKEEYITNDVNNPVQNSSAKPEYVIKLTSEAIKEIRNQTNSYNASARTGDAYVDYVKSSTVVSRDKDIYYSKFINDNDPANGGFYKYFTVIRSGEVN